MRGFAVVLLLCAACGRGRGGGGIDEDEIEDAAAQALAQMDCYDFVDAYATAADPCYAEDYDDIFEDLDSAAHCAEVVSIRDPEELREQCMPWVEALTCEDFEGGAALELDSSCEAQMQRPAP